MDQQYQDQSTASVDNGSANAGANANPVSGGGNGNGNGNGNGHRRQGQIGPRDYTVAKTTHFKLLAAKIAGEARKGTIQSLRAMGANNINTVVKGFALARRYIEEQHIDINCQVQFIEVASTMSGGSGDVNDTRTAIRFTFNRTALRSQVRSD